ncbi:MAG: CAP domain-containing protein [Acidimicrobiales bacterium]
MSAFSAPRTASDRSPRRRTTTALLGLVLLATAAGACLPADAQTFLERTNALRSSQGVPALADHDALTQHAEEWARHLAETGVLAHSQLSKAGDGLAWTALAENVGVSSPTEDTLRTIQDQLAASSEHRANMVNGQFTHMGVGVAEGADGRVWVVEVFAAL